MCIYSYWGDFSQGIAYVDMIVNSQSQQVAQSGEHLRCQTGKTIIIKCPNGNKVSRVISNYMHVASNVHIAVNSQHSKWTQTIKHSFW